MLSLSSPLSLYAIPAMWVISYYPVFARVSHVSPSILTQFNVAVLAVWDFEQGRFLQQVRGVHSRSIILTFHRVLVFSLVATCQASQRRKISPPTWRQSFTVSKEHMWFVFVDTNILVFILIHLLAFLVEWPGEYAFLRSCRPNRKLCWH